jgi:hypothetical protein
MKYSREYIERLLGKFVDGLTTELEEQQLAEYFDTADDIPAEWQVYKEMFRSFKTDDYNFSNAELDAMLTSDVVFRLRTVSKGDANALNVERQIS